jgi:hypothetical protein
VGLWDVVTAAYRAAIRNNDWATYDKALMAYNNHVEVK